jgi:hypothetical protein
MLGEIPREWNKETRIPVYKNGGKKDPRTIEASAY